MDSTVGQPEHVPTFASFFPETALEEFDLALRRDEQYALNAIRAGIATSFAPYGMRRELRVVGIPYPTQVTALGSASWPAVREGEPEDGALPDLCLCPDPAAVTLDDPADGREPDPGTGELLVGM